ncbi:riboflavin synthase [Candidatus Peribacteria bacterium]|nr:riboflavin synthase [Candidatus Peribacteria bacterium]
MFSGIVEATARIVDKTEATLTLERPKQFDDLIIGASIAVSGVCLSVTAYNEDTMTFDVVDETWQKSKLGSLSVGDSVNLERSVTVDSRLDGHIVQGHVEGRGKIVAAGGGGKLLTAELPEELIKFCIQKGSIAIDGVSLTIASIQNNTIEVALVPHTLEHTALGSLKEGDLVNIETDILGRYLYAFSLQEAHAH